jgi:signal transduction histidine kinase
MAPSPSRAVQRASLAAAPAGLLPALATIALCAVALAFLQLAVVLTNDSRGVSAGVAALPALAGLLCVGAGLVAWGRRPHNRIGPLLSAAGLAWIGWGLRAADIPVLAAAGLMCEGLPFAIVVHLLLAFPSGRLEGPAERVVVAAGYLLLPLVHAPAELLGASRGDDIRVLDVVDDPGLAEAASAIQTIADVVLLAAAGVVVGRRLLASDRGSRRLTAPLYLAGLVALAVVLLLDALDGAGFTASGAWPVDLVDAVGVAVVLLLPLAFLLATLMGGFARAGELGELVRRLGDAPIGHAPLAAALADALGDPSAELAYWLPTERRYVDEGGIPLERGAGRGMQEVTHDRRRVGAIVYDDGLLRDPEPVRSVAAVVGLALDHERLTAELRASARDLRLSRARLAEVADAERRRIARDLHDGAQQRLVLLAIESDRLRRCADQPDVVRRAALDLRQGLDDAVTDIRRMVQGIVPPLLAERGLRTAVEELAAQAPIPVTLDSDPSELEAPAHVESAGYFVISEGLVNVVKHAGATSATVSLLRGNGALRIEVADDGVGGADPSGGTGLRGLADRVSALNGRLDIVSPPKRGTRVRAEIPLA